MSVVASSARWIGVVAMLGIVASFGLTACGGGGGASSEEIAQAEKHARYHQRAVIRKRKLEHELKQLLKSQKNGGTVPNPNPNPAPAPTTPESAPSSSTHSCGNELSASSDTTCEFAENVRAAYESEYGSGSGSIVAYSPANNENYVMSCTSAPHECTGAIDAIVYFP